MEVTQVLRMNGGMGDTSYANNSLVQQKVLALTKPIREEALTSLYCKLLPETLVIADLGCSSGPNTLYVVSEVINTVEKLCRELSRQSPEYQVFLNDLPGNDFNNIFRSLSSFNDKLTHEMLSGISPLCFLSGLPGSFYGRLFPSSSLHFVHSSYSLQWLSQVPEGVENNKGNIYMASTSPTNVLKAYYQQFQRDFQFFLQCRAKEVVEGGCMVLTFLGRKSQEPSSKECCLIWELMAKALNDMASKTRDVYIGPIVKENERAASIIELMGIIKEEEVDSFNIPQYTPSPSEVEEEVVKEGSFRMNHMVVSAVDWNAYSDWNTTENEFSEMEVVSDGAYNVTKCMRAVAEPLLTSHFGDDIIEQLFTRYQGILTDQMSKHKTQFINVTLSITRRGD